MVASLPHFAHLRLLEMRGIQNPVAISTLDSLPSLTSLELSNYDAW